MNVRSRRYPDLLILLSSEGAGFPYPSQDAPAGLIIDLALGTWHEPRRHPSPIAIGQPDPSAFGARNVVLGVFRLDDFEHMREALACSQEVHRRVMGRTGT